MIVNEEDGVNADNQIPNSTVQAWFVAIAVAREIQNGGGGVDTIVFSSYYETKHLSRDFSWLIYRDQFVFAF